MKHISITGFYTEPKYQFDLSVEFLGLLASQIEQKLLPTSANQSEELEIYLYTDNKSQTLSVQKITKTAKSKYLTFHFLIPFQSVVTEMIADCVSKVDLQAFTKQFFACLTQTQLFENQVLNQTQNAVLAALNEKDFSFQATEKEIELRLAKRKLLTKV